MSPLPFEWASPEMSTLIGQNKTMITLLVIHVGVTHVGNELIILKNFVLSISCNNVKRSIIIYLDEK